jgi:hypothetical protein
MLPPTPRIRTYTEFWPFYLQQHSRRGTKIWHATGTLLGLGVLAFALAKGRPGWILWALVPGYALAWISHFFIEHNRPATFRYPLWSFFSDFRMLALMLRRKI